MSFAREVRGYAENRFDAKATYNKGLKMEGKGRRALSDISNVVGRNPQAVGAKKFAAIDRPVTRNYIATLANNQHLVQDTQHDKNIYEVEESVVVDMEDLNGPSAFQPEECNEVEMEDPFDPMVISNIDEDDGENQLAVTEYVQDIYTMYRERENLSCVPRDYMWEQTDINERMRGILIDWLIEVHLKFELMDETLFLTVNIIDRYLSRERVLRKHLQLVGVTAMLLACKYEEVSVPVVDDFVQISDKAYTREEVLQMEKSMLNALEFNMTVPTPYVFIRRFLKAAEFDKELETLSFFFIELCLVEYEMLRYPPSMVAAAVVYTAQCTLNRVPYWNRTMECHSGYSEVQLWECAKMIVDYHRKAGQGKLTCVHRKYSSSKYNCAARIEPALIIGEEILD
ncbi:hypothetical protein SUGI_0268950 [Cryptomeria japonica]|uniref:G2/mitotic-specific cyclin-2 n=1 Tax=Cryptomeria japonica TaxID=3369 RepID=UPI002408CA1E|nr:G2/mitotic-specific cyclin-2 [Cryptomeria japonica]GLJ16133.1 hypothetical protein SUGI_0268950 [Cryptomeria japonica]